MRIGITERGDAALDTSWIPWVQEGKPAILISKDPNKLFKILSKNDLLTKNNYVVHCTITGMGQSVVEPNVPEYSFSLQGYYSFVQHIGPLRTVLRIDPIIATPKGIFTASNVAEHALGRVRISFLDMYDHVKKRFEQEGIKLPYTTFHASKEVRAEAFAVICDIVNKVVTTKLNLPTAAVEVCGEPDFECTGCVSKLDLKTMGIDHKPSEGGFQRKFCCCIAEKFELLKQRKRCSHQCLYCYYGKYE